MRIKVISGKVAEKKKFSYHSYDFFEKPSKTSVNQIFFEFEPYQDQFFLTVNGYPVPLSEKDVDEIAPFVKAEGCAGHSHLREWFKVHRPLFFKHVITECDRSELVKEVLRYLKNSRYYSESKEHPNLAVRNKRSI